MAPPTDNDATPIDVPAEVLAAERRIRPHIRRTPLERSGYLSRLSGAEVYLKLECAQTTGSFKLRGAMNKMLSLGEPERRAGVLTASSGNHGTACAYLMGRFGIPGTIYLPESVSAAKLEAIESYGARTELVSGDGIEAERLARRLAAESGRTYVSPYNDAHIIGGQGTAALEIMEDLECIDTVLIPIGGGGLAAGMAGHLKSINADIEIVGCQPHNSRVMYESIRAGRILDLESSPTLSDGTAGGIDHDSISFDLCRRLIDDFALLAEQEIGAAIILALDKHHLLIEGAGALPIAALLQEPQRYVGKTVVLVLSGSKLGLETLRRLLDTSH